MRDRPTLLFDIPMRADFYLVLHTVGLCNLRVKMKSLGIPNSFKKYKHLFLNKEKRKKETLEIKLQFRSFTLALPHLCVLVTSGAN